MAVPDYQSLMLPLLKLTSDRQEHSLSEAIEILSQEFGLSNDDRKELLPSGRQFKFDNRVGWACTYIKKAGLLESTRRGRFRITSRGIEVLKSNPEYINNTFLKQYSEFLEFQNLSRKEIQEMEMTQNQIRHQRKFLNLAIKT